MTDESSMTREQNKPTLDKDVMEYLIVAYTNSANALIDYVGCKCTSVKAFDELLARQYDVLAQITLEYKRRIKK